MSPVITITMLLEFIMKETFYKKHEIINTPPSIHKTNVLQENGIFIPEDAMHHFKNAVL